MIHKSYKLIKRPFAYQNTQMRYSQEDFHFQLASLMPKVAVQCLIQARYLEQKENM